MSDVDASKTFELGEVVDPQRTCSELGQCIRVVARVGALRQMTWV